MARAISDSPDFRCKPPHPTHPLCNTSLPSHAGAAFLVSLLTLHEKAAQHSSGAGPTARLGLPAFQWCSESLHALAGNGPGVRFSGSVRAATSFQQVLLAAAAALSRNLWFEVAAAVGVEARAIWNVGQAGLTYWTPNINVFRDPMWGRGQETPGEDPAVTAAYAVEYVKGLQGGRWRCWWWWWGWGEEGAG